MSVVSSFSVLHRGNDRKRECLGIEGLFSSSGALVFKVILFHAPAKGQQVAVGLDPLCQLCTRESGGEDGEEVTEHQSVQFRRAVTHRHSVFRTVRL